jgi:hypothetical protein
LTYGLPLIDTNACSQQKSAVGSGKTRLSMGGAVQRFECTNCGGPDLLTILAFAVALFSLFVAFASFKMQRREHRAFLRRLEAEPNLEFSPPRTSVTADEDGVIRLSALHAPLRLALGLDNVGDAPATDVLLNLLLPRTVPFFWCDSHGVRLADQTLDANRDSTETLNDGEHDVPVHWRGKRLDRLGRHRHYPFYVELILTLPLKGSMRVPMRFKVISDDLRGGSEIYGAPAVPVG